MLKPETTHAPCNIAAVILAGGKGTRLRSITNGLIPKSAVTLLPSERLPGHDFIAQLCTYLGISHILWVADTHLDYYQCHLPTEPTITLLPQNLWPNTTGAILEALTQVDSQTQLLVMSSDLLCAPADVKKLVSAHQPGQLTWATASIGQPEMTGYETLLVDQMNNIVGDSQLAPLPTTDQTPVTTVTKLGLQLIDPDLLLTAWELGQNAGLPTDQLFDWYWGLCPQLETWNYQRVLTGKPSVVKAVTFDHPAIDYGTPERLAISRWLSTLLLAYA